MEYNISGSLRHLLNVEALKSRPISILNRCLCRANRGCKTRILNSKPIGDYFTFRERHGMISYMPRGKVQGINQDGTWKLEGRQAIAPGRWLRSMFSERAIKLLKIKDNEFADIATAIKAIEGAPGMRFKLVSVEEGYKSSNFIENPPDSCMWNEPVEEFYDLFNAEVLVCVNDDGLFRARAVVWPNVNISGIGVKCTFMDRIYCDAPEVVRAMQAYATSKGWAYKIPQSRGSGAVMLPDGTTTFPTMWIRYGGTVCADFYPYLDTFQYGDDESISTSSSYNPYVYNLTDGNREEEDQHAGQVRDVDGDWIDEDDAVYIDRRRHSGYYHINSDLICRLDNGDWDLREHCVEIDDRWYRDDDDDVVYLESTGCYYLISDGEITLIDGEWYEVDDDKVVEVDGEYFLKDSDDVVETRTGRFLKDDCVEFQESFYHKEDMVSCGEVLVPKGYVAEDQPDQLAQISTPSV